MSGLPEPRYPDRSDWQAMAAVTLGAFGLLALLAALISALT